MIHTVILHLQAISVRGSPLPGLTPVGQSDQVGANVET